MLARSKHLTMKSIVSLIFLNGVIACAPGWYGDDCKDVCPKNCLDKVCDVKDGRCNNCSVGWMGSDCESSCQKGNYGKDCAFVCKGYCKDGCNKVNGTCDDGCDPGWYTDGCNKECPSPSYGAECKFTCGHCRDGVRCNPVTGQCRTGCEPGYIGQNCNNVCPDGHYGEKCEKTCGKDAKCNHVTGACCGITELRKLVKEKEEELDNENHSKTTLIVFLSASMIVIFGFAVYLCYKRC